MKQFYFLIFISSFSLLRLNAMDNKRCKVNSTKVTTKKHKNGQKNSEQKIESLSKQMENVPLDEQENNKMALEKWIKICLEYLSHSDEATKEQLLSNIRNCSGLDSKKLSK